MTTRTRQGAKAWFSRGLTAALLAVGATAGAVAGAGSAAAATTTINCDSAAHPSADWTNCQKLVGTAKCVWNNKNGTYTLAVGYTNPTTYNLYAVVPNTTTNTTGPNNAFTATQGFAANPGHAATFVPGVYTTAWTVTWTPSSSNDLVSWALMGHTYTWANTYTACPSKPVPVIGNGIAASTGVAAIMGLSLLNRRRLRAVFRATGLTSAPSV